MSDLFKQDAEASSEAAVGAAPEASLVSTDGQDEEKAVALRYTGGFLTPETAKGYEVLLSLCDRRPLATRLNEDFALIPNNRGAAHIEPTRTFCLKAVAVFGLSYEPVGEVQVVDDGKWKLVTTAVRVSVGDRFIVESGACSTEETKKSYARAYHDAIGRATTRAMKRALEAVIGLPFINDMVRQLFGGYQVGSEPEERNVSPKRRELTREEAEKLPPKIRELARSMYRKLRDALAEYLITQEEHDARWERVLLNLENYPALGVEESNLDELIAERRKVAEENSGGRR